MSTPPPHNRALLRRRQFITVVTAAAAMAAAGCVPSIDAPEPGTSRPLATTEPNSPPMAEEAWTLVWEDDFSTLDRENWGVYNGPGNGLTGPRSRLNTFVQDGNLILRTAPINGVWHGAGVSSRDARAQKYGKFVIQARFEAGYGVRAVALLWPSSGRWPPEVDFLEISARDANRTENVIANHYRDARGMHQVHHRRVEADFTRWHTIAVEWTPTLLRYTLDGVTVAEMTEHVPREPMWLGLQTAQGVLSRGIVPNVNETTTVDFVVDKVEVYIWNRRSA